jgi:hypothetical protein
VGVFKEVRCKAVVVEQSVQEDNGSIHLALL